MGVNGFVLRLSDDWALGSDPLQWIVYRWRKLRGETKWQAVSFVESETSILRRVLYEQGVVAFPEADAALNAFPDSFRKWMNELQSFGNP
jgi:hypothetical protein